MSEAWLIRIGILVASAILVIAIIWQGRPKKTPQGKRIGERGADRSEPGMGDDALNGESDDMSQGGQSELPLSSADSELGKRADESFDKIVAIYVAAKAGQTFHGPDIVVAAEKTGLTFGHMSVFHRLVERQPERGPVFSVANIVKPGNFDMADIHAVETPALAFFLTLPAPVTALEGWEMMLPTATRIAELLDGVVLDEDRNALGRQRIQHIREELRTYDRQREAPLLRPNKW
jgi:cell division protein ZipA